MSHMDAGLPPVLDAEAIDALNVPESTISVLVPASTSNLGAGFDCLGIALDLWLEARLVPGEGPPSYTGTLEGMTGSRDIVSKLLADAPSLDGHRLELHSEIPVANGLGSSAAAVVAGMTLASLLRGDTPDRDAVYHETVRHEGHPDNAGPAVYGGAVLAVRWSGPADESEDTEPRTIGVDGHLGFALAVPETGIDTADARRLLPEKVDRSLAVGQASRAAALVSGLLQGDGDLIAFGMEDLIATPVRSGLIKGYEAACGAGIEAGAYGVTISGSGAALVAITLQEKASGVAEAMARAMTRQGNPAGPYAPRMVATGVSWRRDD